MLSEENLYCVCLLLSEITECMTEIIIIQVLDKNKSKIYNFIWLYYKNNRIFKNHFNHNNHSNLWFRQKQSN